MLVNIQEALAAARQKVLKNSGLGSDAKIH